MIHVKCVAQCLTEASVQLKVAIFMKQIEPSKSQRICETGISDFEFLLLFTSCTVLVKLPMLSEPQFS